MDISYSELFKSIPQNQQQHFSHNVQPEVAAGYLYALQNQMKKKKKRSQPSTPEEGSPSPSLNDISLNPSAIPAEMAVKKRRKGSDPRKCYNDTCDRIVTKRNYCYKCQKRKERGLALNPKLPSIKQLLLPSDKKQRTRKATVPSTDALPNVNDINNNSINTPTQTASSFLPFNIVPNIKEPSDKLPNYFETVLVNLMKEKNASLPLNTPTAPSAESQTYNPNFMPNNTMFNSSNFSAADKQQLQNLHQYLLQLSNGSEEKASTLLSHYISARNSQAPSASTFSATHLTFDQTSHSSPFSPFPPNFANAFTCHNDPFNLFSPSNNNGSFTPSDRSSAIKFGPNDMFLLPSPHQVRPNLFATPDHNNPFNPAFINAQNNSNMNNGNHRMRFF